MTDLFAASPSATLSPAFDRARRLSRLLAVLFAVGFWVTLVWVLTGFILVASPGSGGFSLGNPLPLGALTVERRAIVVLAVMITTVPSLLALRTARRVFLHFAVGRVFTAATIGSIRSTAVWLIVVPFALTAQEVIINLLIPSHPVNVNATPSLLFVGIGTYVTAYVMGEARRIADDNASFV